MTIRPWRMKKPKELLKTYPNLKRNSEQHDIQPAPGAGLAVKGLQDKVMVVGASLVSVTGQYLESGAVKLISFWDPADAGFVMNKLAVMLLEGQDVTEGIDLGVPGYNSIKKDGKVLYGSAWVDVTKENMDKYNF